MNVSRDYIFSYWSVYEIDPEIERSLVFKSLKTAALNDKVDTDQLNRQTFLTNHVNLTL